MLAAFVLRTLSFGLGLTASPLLLLVMDPVSVVIVLVTVPVILTAILVWETKSQISTQTIIPLGIITWVLWLLFKKTFSKYALSNIFLAIFNLLPVYPLDGGQIFGTMISKYNPNFSSQLREYGPKVLLGVILFGLISGVSIIGFILIPISDFIRSIFEAILNVIFYPFL